MNSPYSKNTRQQSVRWSRPNPRVWCTSPVVGSHFGRPCCRLHGSGRVCFISGDPSGLREGFFSQALTLFGGGVNCPVPEAPLFRGVPTEPKVFFKMPGRCELWPCARTHLKKALRHTHPVGGPEDEYSWPDPRVWCASPVVGLHFGRPCCQLCDSSRVYLGTGNPSGLSGPSRKL